MTDRIIFFASRYIAHIGLTLCLDLSGDFVDGRFLGRATLVVGSEPVVLVVGFEPDVLVVGSELDVLGVGRVLVDSLKFASGYSSSNLTATTVGTI